MSRLDKALIVFCIAAFGYALGFTVASNYQSSQSETSVSGNSSSIPQIRFITPTSTGGTTK